VNEYFENQCNREILKALLYFDIFNYPLTENEIYQNLAIDCEIEKFTACLNSLIEQGILRRIDGFILHVDANQENIQHRLNGNRQAEEMLPLAFKYSKKIAWFPFVESVCLSGSLSKNYYDQKSDIDYFIVSSPNRLWVCRTFLVLYIKLLPKKEKKFWCVNYFISSESLAIPDENQFVATELAYLIPTVNYKIYQRILENNLWYKKLFPNKIIFRHDKSYEKQSGLFKIFIETLLNGKMGDIVDDLLFKITLKRWQKKYPDMSNEDFDLQYRTRKHSCKRHSKGFQNKVLSLWENKIANVENVFKVFP
jgi:hypothetical protein